MTFFCIFFLCSFLFFPFFPHRPYHPLLFWMVWRKTLIIQEHPVLGILCRRNQWFYKGLIPSQQSNKSFSPSESLHSAVWTSGQRGRLPSFRLPQNTASWSMFMPHLEHKPSAQASLSGATTNYGGEFFSNFELQFLNGASQARPAIIDERRWKYHSGLMLHRKLLGRFLCIRLILTGCSSSLGTVSHSIGKSIRFGSRGPGPKPQLCSLPAQVTVGELPLSMPSFTVQHLVNVF